MAVHCSLIDVQPTGGCRDRGSNGTARCRTRRAMPCEGKIEKRTSLRCCNTSTTDVSLVPRPWCPRGAGFRDLASLSAQLPHRHVSLVGDSMMSALYHEWVRQVAAQRVSNDVILNTMAARKPTKPRTPMSAEVAQILTAKQRRHGAIWCTANQMFAPDVAHYSKALNLTLSYRIFKIMPSDTCSARIDSLATWVAGGSLRDLNLNGLVAALASADVTTVNIGVHWNRDDQDHYRSSLDAVLRRVAEANRDHARPRLALYQQTWPQHFPSEDGSWGYAGQHRRQCAPLNRTHAGTLQWRAVMERAAAVNAKLSNHFVVPGLCPLFDRWDAHPTLAVPDCTHPCYDSNVMAAMVEPLLWTISGLQLPPLNDQEGRSARKKTLPV